MPGLHYVDQHHVRVVFPFTL
eukprot:COSAG02_NODE_60793_length_270_cov_0.795322_2_plen_20_part_01